MTRSSRSLARLFLAAATCYSVLAPLCAASLPSLRQQLGAATVYRLAAANQGVLDAAVHAIHRALRLAARLGPCDPGELKGLAFCLGQLGGAVLQNTRNILSLAHFRSREVPPEGLPYARAVRATLCRPERVRAQLEAGIGALHAEYTAGAAAHPACSMRTV